VRIAIASFITESFILFYPNLLKYLI